MRITVFGSGAWGTALAICLCKNGHEVTLWCRSREKAEQIRQSGVNSRLGGVALPKNLHISEDPNCGRGSKIAVIGCPSFAIRETCRRIRDCLDDDVVLVSAVKGIEQGTLLRMSQVIHQETGHFAVVLTGPTHAEELALGLPTACVAASPRQADAELVQSVFMCDYFRVYTSPDIVGAELGGALKNVFALCAGITDGMGYGDNMKAMLMTRGMTEMARLGTSLNAKRDTFAGLTGMGDLIVTCTSMHSRNRRAGILIGKGMEPLPAIEQVGATVEGYYAAQSAWELARRQGVEMPIVHAAYAVLYQGFPVTEVMEQLLSRSQKPESEDSGWN